MKKLIVFITLLFISRFVLGQEVGAGASKTTTKLQTCSDSKKKCSSNCKTDDTICQTICNTMYDNCKQNCLNICDSMPAQCSSKCENFVSHNLPEAITVIPGVSSLFPEITKKCDSSVCSKLADECKPSCA